MGVFVFVCCVLGINCHLGGYTNNKTHSLLRHLFFQLQLHFRALGIFTGIWRPALCLSNGILSTAKISFTVAQTFLICTSGMPRYLFTYLFVYFVKIRFLQATKDHLH